METKRITDINGLMHLWKVDNLYLAGQPSLDSWSQIKDLNLKMVINLRGESEMDFSDQEMAVKDLGIEYHHFPIVVDGKLDATNADKLSKLLNEKDNFFIHCGSANRVAGWLITYLVKYREMNFDDAVAIAQENGLSNPGFIDQAQDIISN